jgi:3-hydroxyacyl-CoA dehydrogenase
MENKIAVLGAGTMGPGIAVSYLLGGYEVAMYSRRESTLEQARKVVAGSLSLFTEEDLISAAHAEDAMNRLQLTTDLAFAVADAWYIAETIVENPEAKTALYQQLDALLPEDIIIASNTSYLDIFDLMPQRRLPYTVISHWYAPAHILPLVEVVKGDKTLPSVMDRTVSLHKQCGKQPVRMEKFIPGFIVNRMQSAMGREVSYLIENGYCTAEELDLAVKTSLMPRGLLLGLVQRLDFNGLDMVAHSMRNKSYSPAPVTAHPHYILDPVERGEYGIKSGKGIYDYSHMPREEVLRIRDKQLLRSVRLGEDFLQQPLHRE